MVIDIILIVLFVLMVLHGYNKGFIGIVTKLVSLIIALVLAYFLAETVGNYVAETSMGETIKTGIEGAISDKLETVEKNETINMLQEKLNFKNVTELKENITNYAYTGVGFIIVFVVSRIILWIVQKVFEKIFDLPVLKTFNKLGGIIAATVLFVIEVSTILAVIKSLSTLQFMTSVIRFIESSVITKLLYDHNIVASLILSKILR